MANIITDLGGGELSVNMNNARFARQPIPSIFTGWTTLRVALLMRMTDAGADITGTPRFGFGLCSGSSNILGDTTTTNFCGAISNMASWTRNVGPGLNFRVGSGFGGESGFSPATRVGSTLTTQGTGFVNGGVSRIHTTAAAMYFVDITVGSPNYSLSAFYYGNTDTAPSVTLADFYTQSLIVTPAFTNHTRPSPAVTIAVDEATNGVFDHSCVWWDQAVADISILAWRVYRLA